MDSSSSFLITMLREQLEFYFSTPNIMRDRWLQRYLLQNNAGFVPVSIFLTCNRIIALTDKVEYLVEAIRTSKLLEMSPCGEWVKRKFPIESDYDPNACTVHVSPWNTNTVSIEDTKAWAEYYAGVGTVAAVWKRKKRSNLDSAAAKPLRFANATFIEFKKPHMATEFAMMTNKLKSMHYPAAYVQIKSKNEWLEEKREYRRCLKDASLTPSAF